MECSGLRGYQVSGGVPKLILFLLFLSQIQVYPNLITFFRWGDGKLQWCVTVHVCNTGIYLTQ